MRISDIKLGENYYCLFKTSLVDTEKRQGVLWHIAYAKVTAKGVEQAADGQPELFIEIANQRVKVEAIRASIDDIMDLAKEKQAQLETVPQTE